MIINRRCDGCGEAYETPSKLSRFCSKRCRTRAWRSGGVPKASVSQIGVRKPADLGPGRQERAVQADLDAIEQAGSTLGAAALALARKIDKESDTGSALASMISQLRMVMAEAKAAGVAPERTVVGGLRLVRDQIRGG